MGDMRAVPCCAVLCEFQGALSLYTSPFLPPTVRTSTLRGSFGRSLWGLTRRTWCPPTPRLAPGLIG